MIAFDEALAAIADGVSALGTQSVEIAQAHGRILAQDLTSAIALPPFTQSAMDGWAVHGASAHIGPLEIVQGIFAGQDHTARAIAPHQAAPIATGAGLPAGADTVVRRERAAVVDAALHLEHPVSVGADVRAQGEWLAQGAHIARAGARLTPQVAAVAATCGVAHVEVWRVPRVALFTSGDEIISPGQPRQPWQIYDGNSSMLLHMLAGWGLHEVALIHLEDDPKQVRKQLDRASTYADLIVTTGGASVGQRDELRRLSQEHAPLYAKVAQRPGKPTFLTRRHGTLWVGLPGPPLAAHASAQTHLKDVVAALQGAPCAPWSAVAARTFPSHPTMTRLALAAHTQEGWETFEAASPYQALARATHVLAVSPGGAHIRARSLS